jgi:hypothetical protein
MALAILISPVYAQQPVPPDRGEAADKRNIESAAATSRQMSRQVANQRLRAELERYTKRGVLPAAVLREVDDLYRSPSAKELKILQPMDEDKAKYGEILKNGKSGLVRLVEDAGCGDTTKTVSAAGPCLDYSMPGNGSSYSFRLPNYRLRRLADLHFANGNFITDGIMHHSFITGIGDVPLNSPELAKMVPGTVMSFRPVTDISKALEVDEKLRYGWREGRLYFGKEVRAIERMTYILRSVAYNGNYLRSVKGVVYDELEFDKRADVTVAFRIIRKHDDGSITILWKELARRASPKLIENKKTKNEDLKKEQFQAKGP